MIDIRSTLLAVPVLLVATLVFPACSGSSTTTEDDSGTTDSDTGTPDTADTEDTSDTGIDPSTVCTMGTVQPFGLVNNTDHFYLDTWYVPLLSGDTVRIWADNNAGQAGDIAAFAFNSTGTLVGKPEAGAWDNEWTCSNATADSTGCPDVTYTASQAEEWFAVGIGAWSGSSSPIGYCVTVLKNGTAADLSTLSGDETTMPWPG